MTEEHPKVPPAPGEGGAGEGDASRPAATVPVVGVREATMLGVAPAPGATPFGGSGEPPVVTTDKPREATILGVGLEPTPAALVVASESSVTDLSSMEAAVADSFAASAQAPLFAEPMPPPPAMPAPLAVPAPPAAPAPMPPASSARSMPGDAMSDSLIRAAGVPRSGLAWKVVLLLAVGGAGVAGYLGRDRIAKQLGSTPVVTPPPPSASVSLPSAMPAVPPPTPAGAIEDASPAVAADASADAGAKDASVIKDAGPHDAGKNAKDAGAKGGGLKDAGAAKHVAGKVAPKPAAPKAKPKPAPAPTPTAEPEP
jgi:hypothetical protein